MLEDKVNKLAIFTISLSIFLLNQPTCKAENNEINGTVISLGDLAKYMAMNLSDDHFTFQITKDIKEFQKVGIDYLLMFDDDYNVQIHINRFKDDSIIKENDTDEEKLNAFYIWEHDSVRQGSLRFPAG
jgi:hypothetical protein